MRRIKRGGTSSSAATTTVTTTAPASPATQSAPASTAPQTNGSEKVPDFQPSTVVSKSAYSTVLKTPAPVSQVGAFYEGVLSKGGWEIRSKSTSSYHASFTAHRTGEGVTISVYRSLSGSGISISTHPE